MGARGPAPKPPDGRQGSGQPVRVDLSAGITPPPAPDGLLPSTVESWDAYWRSEVAPAAREVDLPALRRLIIYYDKWDRLHQADDEPFAEGSTGQIKIHPGMDYTLKLEGVISKLEAQLGLTPYARSRLGLTIGQAKLTAHELNKKYQQTQGAGAQPLDPEIAGLLEEPARKPKRKRPAGNPMD